MVSRPTSVGRPGLRLQVEHGLDARHPGLPGPQHAVPQAPPGRDHLQHALQRRRELRPAAVPRRGGARQEVPALAHARHPLGAVRQPAPAVRLPVRPPGQEAAVHGRRVRPGQRMGPQPGAGLGACSSSPSTRACAPWWATSTPSTAGCPPCTSRTARPDGFQWIDSDGQQELHPGPAPARRRRLVRGGRAELHGQPAIRLPGRRAGGRGATRKPSIPMPAATAARTSATTARSPTTPVPMHGFAQSLALTLPPLAAVFFRPPA